MNNILTEENIKKLREELDYRMTVKRAEIAKDKLIAAAHGDRSENAEYKAACENYRENDNRIQYLLTMISTATVVDDSSLDKSNLSRLSLKVISTKFLSKSLGPNSKIIGHPDLIKYSFLSLLLTLFESSK